MLNVCVYLAVGQVFVHPSCFLPTGRCCNTATITANTTGTHTHAYSDPLGQRLPFFFSRATFHAVTWIVPIAADTVIANTTKISNDCHSTCFTLCDKLCLCVRERVCVCSLLGRPAIITRLFDQSQSRFVNLSIWIQSLRSTSSWFQTINVWVSTFKFVVLFSLMSVSLQQSVWQQVNRPKFDLLRLATIESTFQFACNKSVHSPFYHYCDPFLQLIACNWCLCPLDWWPIGICNPLLRVFFSDYQFMNAEHQSCATAAVATLTFVISTHSNLFVLFHSCCCFSETVSLPFYCLRAVYCSFSECVTASSREPFIFSFVSYKEFCLEFNFE